MENIILIVFMLNIESSYLNNIEQNTASPADTIQFMLIDGVAWRIKTYALDHDVHVWNLGSMETAKFFETAVTNTEKHYGDVLNNKFILQTTNGFEGLQKELKKSGLPQNLEIPKSKEFAFWVSELNIYKSKSTLK
jgi:hypothetical protein